MSKSNTAKKSAAEPRILEEVNQTAPTAVEVPLTADGRKNVVDLSMEQIGEHGWKNTSESIRGLYALGYSKSAIAKFLGKRYQHVRNVLITPLKKVPANG